MDSFLYSINATVPIFLVMIVGWVIKQLGVIDDHFANVANKYVFKVALPVLLFRDLAAAGYISVNIASSCALRNSGDDSDIPVTPKVFCAVMAVIADIPYTLCAANVFKSA